MSSRRDPGRCIDGHCGDIRRPAATRLAARGPSLHSGRSIIAWTHVPGYQRPVNYPTPASQSPSYRTHAGVRAAPCLTPTWCRAATTHTPATAGSTPTANRAKYLARDPSPTATYRIPDTPASATDPVKDTVQETPK